MIRFLLNMEKGSQDKVGESVCSARQLKVKI